MEGSLRYLLSFIDGGFLQNNNITLFFKAFIQFSFIIFMKCYFLSIQALNKVWNVLVCYFFGSTIGIVQPNNTDNLSLVPTKYLYGGAFYWHFNKLVKKQDEKFANNYWRLKLLAHHLKFHNVSFIIFRQFFQL